MKFTNGYWLTKPEFRMLFATQCVRASQEGRELVLLAAGCPVRHRGDVLAGGALEVRFSAPRANIVRVRITHFAGAADPGPRFSTLEELCRILDIPMMFILLRLIPVYGIVWATPVADILCCATALMLFTGFTGKLNGAVSK